VTGMTVKKSELGDKGCLPKNNEILSRSILAIISVDVGIVSAMGVIGLAYPISSKTQPPVLDTYLSKFSDGYAQWHLVGNYDVPNWVRGQTHWQQTTRNTSTADSSASVRSIRRYELSIQIECLGLTSM